MNRFSTLLIFILSWFTTEITFGQTNEVHHCITDEILERLIANNPEIARKQAEMDRAIYNSQNSATKRGSGDCTVRYIPVVFHIIHNNGSENISDDKVNALIKEVNDVYRFNNVKIEDVNTLWHDVVVDMGIELKLAKIDPDGKPTTGIERIQSAQTSNAYDEVKQLSIWDPTKYLNIWIVKTIKYPGITQGTVLGYAYFPFMENETTSGIVIRSDVIGKNTLPHELGHYLDLYHPFQDGCGTTSCLESGDKVCDTPPTSKANSGCNRGQNTCSNDSPNSIDMIENIMDYTDCRTILTKGQKERVDFTLSNSRKKLVSIANLLQTGVVDSTFNPGKPVASFESDINTICQGESIQFTDYSCTDLSTSKYTWLFPSGTPSVAYTPNVTVTYKKAGIFSATLIVENASGADTVYKANSINVIPTKSDVIAPFFEDFRDANFPYEGWSKISTVGANDWMVNTERSVFAGGSLFLENDIKNANITNGFNLPPIDLSSSNNKILTFYVSYVKGSNNALGEYLRVYGQDGCTGVRSLRFMEQGASLACFDDYMSEKFFPSKPSHWKKFTVDMQAFANSTSLLISFEFFSKGENNIFIDNINLGGYTSSGISETQTSRAVDVFPNPSNGHVDIFINSLKEADVVTVLHNSLGQIVQTDAIEHLLSGDNIIQRNYSVIKPGIYFLSVKIDGQTTIQKLVLH